MKYQSVLLAMSVIGATAYGQTVNWGTACLDPDTTSTYTSDGNPVSTELTWEIGYFDEEFAPTQFNFDSWHDHWNALQSRKGEKSPYTRAGGTVILSNRNLEGRHLYIFAYKDAKTIGTPEGEALLMTKGSWVVPADGPLGIIDACIPDSVTETEDDEVEVIWGIVDTRIDASGGVYGGIGYITDPKEDSSDSTFEAQTASWKPSSMFVNSTPAEADTTIPASISTTPKQ